MSKEKYLVDHKTIIEEFKRKHNYLVDGLFDNSENGIPINLSKIVDNQGNKRFIEGDITCETIEGVTQTYGKWSLSGTHLMVVVAGKFDNGTIISSGTKLCNVNLPSWIVDKIVNLYTGTYAVSIINVPLYKDGQSNQNVNMILNKSTNVYISMLSLTLNNDREFRVQFDLLIDTDAPVSAGE